MATQPSEIQGNSNPANPPLEVREEGSSEGMATNKASQDGLETINEVREEGSSEGMATNKASQDGLETINKVREEGSSEGMATNKASQDGLETVNAVREEGSWEGDEASEEFFKRLNEGSYGDLSNPFVDYKIWLQQKFENQCTSKVLARAVVNESYGSLFDAALKGDWKTITKILNDDHAAMTAEVMTMEDESFTVLDIAIMATQDQLVDNLVKRFPPNYGDLNPERALYYAAKGGRIRMVKALVEKIDFGPKIIGLALDYATNFASTQKEVIWYLARRSTDAPFGLIKYGLIVGGHLARKFPGWASSKDYDSVSCLDFLAIIPRYFRSGAELNFWEKSIYKFVPVCLVDTSFDASKDTKMARVLALDQFKISLWNLATIAAPYIKRTGELKLMHNYSLEFAKKAFSEVKTRRTPEMLNSILTSGVVLEAASRGVFEIVDLFLKHFPELMWNEDFAKELMIKVVEGRHIELFRLVNADNPIRYLTENNLMNFDLMEAVTKWSSRCVTPDVSGAAFLLQRELQWFQAVEASSIPSYKWLKFFEHKKAYWEVFVKEREQLLKEAGQWMKDTSSSCSLVATLILTIAFAATFTVPGGNDGYKGIPLFLKDSSFMVFAVADALALFSSVTATLMFLAILTSRYAIEDFHYSLPRKMILGLTFLFLSLAFMLVAFGSALTIVLNERFKWIYIPIMLLAAFPITLFALLQLPLYVEMVISTSRPRLYRPLKLWK